MSLNKQYSFRWTADDGETGTNEYYCRVTADNAREQMARVGYQVGEVEMVSYN